MVGKSRDGRRIIGDRRNYDEIHRNRERINPNDYDGIQTLHHIEKGKIRERRKLLRAIGHGQNQKFGFRDLQ